MYHSLWLLVLKLNSHWEKVQGPAEVMPVGGVHERLAQDGQRFEDFI